jgi:hypothetical protein
MGNKQTTTKQNDPCHKYACDIQTCLQNNNYSQEKCTHIVQIYNDCVKQYAQKEEEKKEQLKGE